MEEAFNSAQPLCLAIFHEKDPSSLGRRVEELRCLLERMSDSEVSSLSSFISIPVQHVLKQASSLTDATLISALKCMELSLRPSSLPVEPIPFSFFQILLQNLLSLINHSAKVEEIHGSPELKSAVVKTVFCVLEARKPLQADSLPVVAQTIFILLKLLRSETDLPLRILVLKCLSSLCGQGDVVEEKIVLSDRLAAFLPGLSLNLSELLIKTPLLHHNIVIGSLSLFKSILTQVFNDKDFQIASKSNEDNESNTKDETRETKEWFVSKAKILRPIISQLIAVTASHSHFEVRLESVRFCGELMENCSESMVSSLPSLLDALAKLVTDRNEKIATKALEYTSKQKLNAEKWHRIYPAIQENIFKLCTKLPNIIQKGWIDQSSDSVSQLQGYLTILQFEGMKSYFRSAEHSRRFWKALLQCVEFEPRHLSLVSEMKAVDGKTHESSGRIRPSLPLKPGCAERLRELCEFVGSSDSEGTLLTNLLDLHPGPSTDLSGESKFLYLLNSFLKGLKRTENNSNLRFHRLLREILSSLAEQVTTWLSDCDLDETPKDSHVTDPSNFPVETALLAILLLETISCIGDLYASHRLDANQLLLQSLYPILLKSESHISSVKDAGLATLESLSRASGLESITSLLEHHSDYLLYGVSLKLRRLPSNPLAPLAILSVVRHSSPALLLGTRDLISDILTAMDLYHDELCFLPLKTLVHYVTAITSNPQSTECDMKEDDVPPCEEKEEEEGEMVEASRPPAPPSIQLIVNILKRTKHLVSSQHLPLRMFTLDLILESLEGVKRFEDELLPMIHQNWPGVVARFDDWERHVSIKAVKVIFTMARLSSSFVCRRICAEFFPRVVSFLKTSAEKSRGSGKFYEKSGAGLLQQYLLEIIGSLCLLIAPVNPRNLLELETVLNLYDASDQPKVFQSFAKISVENLSQARNPQDMT